MAMLRDPAVLYGTAFLGVAVFSLLKASQFARTMAAEDGPTGPPRVSRDVLLAVLSDVAARAAELVRLLDTAADASKAPAAERAALADAMTGVVQADLEVAQEAVFAAHGVRKADVEASYEWHAASGPGRDRKVVDAASAIRKMVGRHLLTRGKTLSVLREMFEHSITQSDAIADAVAAAAQSGGDVMRVMSTAPMGVANSYLQSRMGMTLQELLARAQVLSAGGVEDAGAQAFMREINMLMEKGQAAVQQSLMENPTMASMFGGMGGGRM